jgi:hypothetical protein
MSYFVLHTNEGQSYVQTTEPVLRREERKYIRKKLDQGMSLERIMFCWSRIEIKVMK